MTTKKQAALKKQIDLEDYLPPKSAPSQQDLNHDRFGREVPDPTPVAPPIGYQKPFSMVDHLRELVRTELSRAAADADVETFEDADDFDIEDDPPDPHTPYEAVFDPVPNPPPTSRPIPAPPEPQTTADPLKSAPEAPTVPIVDNGPTILQSG